MSDFTITVPNDMETTKVLKALESTYIEYTLAATLYNQVKAAKRLGMSRGCLRMKMQEYFGDKYFRNSK